mgnify:CR=1 FL=1
MIDALGIVNFEGRNAEIRGMSEYRTVPAMSFLGRYRIIDFIMSNMVNSGIDQIKILVNDKPRSVIEHLGSGSQYDINFKHGDIQILYPDSHSASSAYFHDLYLMREYIQYLEESKRKYVVIAPSYMVCTIDYSKVVEAHEKSGADITCVYTHAKETDRHFIGCKTLVMESKGKVAAFKDNIGLNVEANIFMETYVMSRELLITLLKQSGEISPLYGLQDLMDNLLEDLKVVGHKYNGYVKCINSLEEYYDANMKMIDYDYARKLFRDKWMIFTKTNDSTPAFYTPEAEVKESVIANGAVIDGTVENCIIGRGVRVRNGAVVRNSLILPNAVIGPGARVEYAVIDKHARVEVKKEIIGSPDDIIYIKRRDRV